MCDSGIGDHNVERGDTMLGLKFGDSVLGVRFVRGVDLDDDELGA